MNAAVSHCAPGIAVPVPGAADVAALLDDADVVDAGLLQPGTGDEPGEPAADERDRHLVGQRVALDARRCRVLEVVGELADGLDVLLVAVGAQPLVTLRGVLLPQRVAVDRGVHDVNNVIGDAVAADPTMTLDVDAATLVSSRHSTKVWGTTHVQTFEFVGSWRDRGRCRGRRRCRSAPHGECLRCTPVGRATTRFLHPVPSSVPSFGIRCQNCPSVRRSRAVR